MSDVELLDGRALREDNVWRRPTVAEVIEWLQQQGGNYWPPTPEYPNMHVVMIEVVSDE
jgi:hypothetical protein